ncbi:sulfurtransferase [Pararobbsia silviterrae]|uniref:Sulfurtransferase n=1 Tax=Pararobbsia silviterrae TaxID=1792498 RepID=A0A494XEZ5_9BURK|nr:sulfurtransferase [Pararobbsia silviterrae]RKP46173.1 sulfurtransferase [Pararobbsia silviterrae]
MAYTSVVQAETVCAQLDDPEWLILDARFTLDDEAWGRREHARGHIPGAHYADLATDLAGPIVAGKTGRRPLPAFDTWRETLSAWGVTPDTQVVVYDSSGGMMAAARVWWMLRWAGHDAVAVLDGGLQRWLALGYPIDTFVAPRERTEYRHAERSELQADIHLVEQHRLDADWALFDSRSKAGYHGEGVYQDPVRGHIAGARLADRADTLGADGRFRSPEALRAHYTQLFGDVDPSRVIFYCGSGVTAAQNLVALAHAGLGDAKHYIGSWSEWILDPARPIAR